MFVLLLGCKPDKSSILPHPTSDQTLRDGWQFVRLPAPNKWDLSTLDELQWEHINIPHMPRLGPLVVNNLWQGHSLYRRTLQIEDAWRNGSVWLQFDGAMASTTVWLNETQVAKHVGGYLPFTVDLSDDLKFGEENELIVLLDNTDNALTGPKPTEILDFLMYGGIYRNVSLRVRDRLHISDEYLADRVGGGGVFVKVPEIAANRAELNIQTHVQNTDRTERRFVVRQTLADKQTGQVVASTSDHPITLAPGGDIDCLSAMTVPNPKLWSTNEPALHVLTTEIVEAGDVVDSRQTTVGIRQVSLRKDGIWINGTQYRLRGVNRHQEYPYIGYAVPDQAQYRDAKLIKEAGFDYVRLSHYPQSPAFMDAADELGLVVINAILGWQYFNEDPRFSDYVVDACRRLIRRDRNHPSVVAWECSLNETDMPPSLIVSLHNAVHEEFPGDQTFSAGETRII
jgi:beta-galactosidase